MRKRAFISAGIAVLLLATGAKFNCIRAQFCSTEQRALMDSTTNVIVCQGAGGSEQAFSQCAVTTPLDMFLADKILMKMAPYSDRSIPQLMIMAANMLIGTPYVAGTLENEIDKRERLVINLHQTDCIIFVETCLNLALAVHYMKEGCTFKDFASFERASRYRNGFINNYCSRIHYTTEWIRQGVKYGNLEDVTMDLGGEAYNHPIFFMSCNYKRYKQLAAAGDSSANYSEREAAAKNLAEISAVERELNKTPITYIPKNKVAACQGKIENGDIICYMSGTPGLDIAHVTIAYVENGRVGFVHASMADMKVEVDKMTIAEYVNSRKSITGIKVIRPASQKYISRELKSALNAK